MTLQQFPLHLRIENALISYERYLGKTFWPVDLAVIYPLPGHLSWIRAIAATAIGRIGRHFMARLADATPAVRICWSAGFGFWERSCR